ncbi:hypothetical protein [Arsenicicoccus dermatophilus]|uniref:hypothetical protein n=1 Tax=Arsenicicoccus dermatophilus TaxID=1076331 RepID=UPI001F4D17F6|nr:hypothetical protein [Arsenicicoccus dermatophilus]MCH8612158.1 hypothetical protein [Arsenicicoccus dermatophilus]
MNPGGSTNDIYNQIGPGFAAFVVVFALALAVWFLGRSMTKHLRTVRYAEALEQQREQEAAPSVGDRPGDGPAGATGTSGQKA